MTTAVVIRKSPPEPVKGGSGVGDALIAARRSDKNLASRLLRRFRASNSAGSPAVWVGTPMRRRPPQAKNVGTRNGGVMPTTVVKSGQNRPPHVTIIQNFGPGQQAQPQPQNGDVYTAAQFAAAIVLVNNAFNGAVPDWRILLGKLKEQRVEITATQAKALEVALIDSLPQIQTPPPPPAVVEAVEKEGEDGEGVLRFFWGGNGPTILSLILAGVFVAVTLLGAFTLFRNKTARTLPIEQPPPLAEQVTPTPDTGGGPAETSTTVYVCIFTYSGWEGGTDVMLAEAATAFYGLPTDKVGLVWSLVKDKPAGPNYPAGTTVNDAWGSPLAGAGVVLELTQDEITNLGGTCTGLWEVKEVEK